MYNFSGLLIHLLSTQGPHISVDNLEDNGDNMENRQLESRFLKTGPAYLWITYPFIEHTAYARG